MSFEGVIGQEEAKRLLLRALEKDRLAHTLLLYGPEGIGKIALAVGLARALVCPESIGGCGVCSACRKVSALSHLDLKILFPVTSKMTAEEEQEVLFRVVRDPYGVPRPPQSASISIGRVRELQREFGHRAYEGRRKVGLILEADRLRTEASNALLKSLEEPPSDTVLILTAVRPDVLLPTITSRCQRIRLRPLSEEQLARAVVEQKGATPEEAGLISRTCDGNLRQALLMTGEDVARWYEEAYRFIDTALRDDRLAGLACIEDLTSDRDAARIERFFGIVTLWLRSALLFSLGGEVGAMASDRRRVGRIAESFGPNRIEEVVRGIDEYLNMMSRNVNVQLILVELWRTMGVRRGDAVTR